jgi:hypothetical protein
MSTENDMRLREWRGQPIDTGVARKLFDALIIRGGAGGLTCGQSSGVIRSHRPAVRMPGLSSRGRGFKSR